MLHHILEHQQSQPDSMVGYFYFDSNDLEKQYSRNAIRSLLFQFALQASDITQDLTRLYETCSSGQQQPPDYVIQLLLIDALARPREKYIILDALDECTDREALWIFLRDLIASKPQDLRILATSRCEKDIEDELSPVTTQNIHIQSPDVDADIRIYIRDRLATDAKLKKWPLSVQDEITTALMARAGGMYG